MSYTNETTYYGLPLPTGSDKSTFTDNNTAFQAVDAALHTAYEQSGAATEDIVAIKATVANLIQADIDFQNDLDTEKGKIRNLQDKEVLQDAEIAAVKADAQDMITAYNEPTATSTHAYNVGDYFIYNDVLYRATDSISIGDTIVPDTNCATTNVCSRLRSIDSLLGYKSSGYSWNTDNNAFYATSENPNSTMRVRSRSGVVAINLNLISKGVLAEGTEYTIATLPEEIRPPHRIINTMNIYSGVNLIGIGKLSINNGVISVIFDDVQTHSEAYLQGEILYIIE